MPDESASAGDEASALRAANARVRRVVEAKDAEIAGLRAALEAGQARQAELVRRLELRVAELERRLRVDSENSSTPPSKDPLAARARRKAAQRSQRERSKERRPGGQGISALAPGEADMVASEVARYSSGPLKLR